MTADTDDADYNLSPMLSQPAEVSAAPTPRADLGHADLSPMISGRGTQIIVDARGAYLAGNLRALIRLLDAPRQLRFRRALLRQALSYADRFFTFQPDSPEMRFLLRLRHWCDDPLPENTAEIV